MVDRPFHCVSDAEDDVLENTRVEVNLVPNLDRQVLVQRPKPVVLPRFSERNHPLHKHVVILCKIGVAIRLLDLFQGHTGPQ